MTLDLDLLSFQTGTLTLKKMQKRKLSPEETPQQTKQAKHDRDKRQQTTTPTPPYSFRLFRSRKDPSKIPPTITPDWTRTELLNRLNYGLKIFIYGDMELFTKELNELRFSPNIDQIRIIDDEAFKMYERISHCK